MKQIGFCIPCYNEEGNILEVYQAITSEMSKLSYDYKILFIDNKSEDNTRQILQQIAEKDHRVILIFNRRNFGPGKSGAYGFFHTPGDAIITMACDLQDPPELIPEFLKKWENGNKLILGKKNSSQEKKSMFMVRKIYYKLTRLLIKDNKLDQITGFGLYDREVVSEMSKIYEPNPNFRFLIQKLGFDIVFINYCQPSRKNGISSYDFFSYFDTAVLSVVSNSKIPLRMISIVGLVSFLLFSLILLAVLIITIFTFSFSENLYVLLSLLILQFISFSIGCIGIVGEYLGEESDQVKHYPLVSVERTINFNEDESA